MIKKLFVILLAAVLLLTSVASALAEGGSPPKPIIKDPVISKKYGGQVLVTLQQDTIVEIKNKPSIGGEITPNATWQATNGSYVLTMYRGLRGKWTGLFNKDSEVRAEGGSTLNATAPL